MSEEEKNKATVDETGAASGETKAEDAAKTAETSAAEDKPKDETKQDAAKQEEKTFTQAELDKVVTERLQRERNKMPSKEELVAFHKWQDGQKSAEELQADKLSEAQRAATEAQAELTKLRQLDAVRKANIDEKFAGFVNYEVTEMAKAKNIGFDEALLLFLKDTTDAYKRQEVRTVTVDTGTKTEAETKETKGKMPKFW